MKKDWMMVERNEFCDGLCNSLEDCYKGDDKCVCMNLYDGDYQKVAVLAQKKLLEYLIGQSIRFPMKIFVLTGREETIQCVVLSQLQVILKEMDTLNDRK